MTSSPEEQLIELAAKYGLAGVPKASAPQAWLEVLKDCSYAPVDYSSADIEYQLAYQVGSGGVWRDLSLSIQWDNRPIAIWPLSHSRNEGGACLTSQGRPVLPPLFVSDAPGKARDKVVKRTLDLANAIAKHNGVTSWESSEVYIGESTTSMWHKESMNRGATCRIGHELYLDLSMEMQAIRGCIRKSYRPLISSAQKLWQEGVLEERDESIWLEFQELHLQAAERKTRSDETWEIQLRHIDAGRAFLVYLRDNAGKMISASLFTCTRDEGRYAVSASNRSYFDKPLSHLIQYRAIEELKRRGMRWYMLGARPFMSDVPPPSEKELSIGYFKAGFASHLFPRFILNHRVTDD